MKKRVTTPFTLEQARDLKCGDSVLISGAIYTARDAAHKRMYELISQGKRLPFDIGNSIVYYTGPAPAKEGMAVGPAGPTTSCRMDFYSPALIALGQRGMIGKGKRSPAVIEAMKKEGAVYFGAVGGAGALLARCVKKAEVIAYEDLGTEAVRRLEVADLPVFVIIDSYGENLYEKGRKEYLESVR